MARRREKQEATSSSSPAAASQRPGPEDAAAGDTTPTVAALSGDASANGHHTNNDSGRDSSNGGDGNKTAMVPAAVLERVGGSADEAGAAVAAQDGSMHDAVVPKKTAVANGNADAVSPHRSGPPVGTTVGSNETTTVATSTPPAAAVEAARVPGVSALPPSPPAIATAPSASVDAAATAAASAATATPTLAARSRHVCTPKHEVEAINAFALRSWYMASQVSGEQQCARPASLTALGSDVEAASATRSPREAAGGSVVQEALRQRDDDGMVRIGPDKEVHYVTQAASPLAASRGAGAQGHTSQETGCVQATCAYCSVM